MRALAVALVACAAAALAAPVPAGAAAVSSSGPSDLALAQPLTPLPGLPQEELAPIETLPARPLAPLRALPAREAREQRRAWVAAFRSASIYARARLGRVSIALVDGQGQFHGLEPSAVYRSASLVKAMMLVALLRKTGDRSLPAAYRRLLGPMITRSDNLSATRVLAIIGHAGLAEVARAAGMHHFATASRWGDTQVAAGDQARFFRRIDQLVPVRHRAYARELLGGVVPYQRWGVGAVPPPGAALFFKGGWRPAPDGWIVHQAALVESGAQRVSLAVLTDGDRSEGYGHETVRGVAERALTPLAGP